MKRRCQLAGCRAAGDFCHGCILTGRRFISHPEFGSVCRLPAVQIEDLQSLLDEIE